ncbi:MAG: hypothetical protein AAFS10_09430 [Myxococcota bacterium]
MSDRRFICVLVLIQVVLVSACRLDGTVITSSTSIDGEADAGRFDDSEYGGVPTRDGAESDGVSDMACPEGQPWSEVVGECLPGVALEGDCNRPPVLEGTIREDTILSENQCFRVEGVLTVDDTAQLTIMPGVELIFAELAGLEIRRARLVAVGLPERPVVLSGEEHRPGFWRGVHIREDDRTYANRLTAVHIYDGGAIPYGFQTYAGNLTISHRNQDRPEVALLGVYLLGGAGVGLVTNNVAITAFEGNVFSGNALGAAALGLADVKHLDEESIFHGNTIERVILQTIFSPRVAGQSSWIDPGVPYLATFSPNLEGRLVMQEGVEIQFVDQARLQIGNMGHLTVRGTASHPVVLTGVEKSPGAWGGLYFNTRQGELQAFEHLHILHAGAPHGDGEPGGAVTVFPNVGDPIRLSLRHVLVRHSGSHGVVLAGSTQVDALEEMVLADNAGAALVIPANAAAALGEETLLARNGDPRIHIIEGSLRRAGRWPTLAEPYLLTEDLNVSARWSLGAGAHVTFAPGVEVRVREQGYVQLEGSAEAPVVLSGAEPNPGSWAGLNLNNTRADNLLTHVVVQHGGSASQANLLLRGTDNGSPLRVAIDHLTLADGDGAGVSLSGNQIDIIACQGVVFEGVRDTVVGDTAPWDASCR